MTKFKKVLFGCIGLYIVALLSVGYAQNAPGTDGASLKQHSGQHIQEIYSQLNLTDDQKKQLEANKQRHRSAMQGLRYGIKTDKEALRGELMKPQLDMPKINTIHGQIKVLQDQMEDEKLNSILAVRTILTPEQFSKFAGLMHQHEQKEHDEEPVEH